jgi:hypothetical protein
MSCELTDAASALAIDWLLATGSPTRPAGCYVALGTGASASGLTGEPSGNGYARQSATFSAASSRATANTAKLTFGPCTSSNWGALTHVGVYSASSGGTCIYCGSLTASKTVNVGDTLEMAIGAVSIAVNTWVD